MTVAEFRPILNRGSLPAGGSGPIAAVAETQSPGGGSARKSASRAWRGRKAYLNARVAAGSR
jgi:hypothetical protein